MALAPVQAAPLAKVKANGVLRVAIYQDNAPWSWEEGGQIRGIDADLGRALAQPLGVRADLAIFPADESVETICAMPCGGAGCWASRRRCHAPCPVRSGLAAQQDQVAIVAPYVREGFGLACATGKGLECEAAPLAFRGHKLAVGRRCPITT
jgi:ABC-type amino acid transport substrate-binding protein